MKVLLLSGRILFSAVFLMTALNYLVAPEFSIAASHGLFYPQWLVAAASFLSLLGGLSVALGFRAKWGASLLIFCLVPFTLAMQDVLALTVPTDSMLRLVVMIKNLSLAGAALFIVHFGSGPWSLDHLFLRDRRGIERKEIDRLIDQLQTQSRRERR